MIFETFPSNIMATMKILAGKPSKEPPDSILDRADESLDNCSNTDEDYSDDGDEGTEGYKIGGYHHVNIGDKFNARYNVIEKLGWGHFSTVWMCWDRKAVEKGASEFVALKIQKSAAHYKEAALDEIELLACAAKASRSDQVIREFGPSYDPCVVLLLNHFDHNGPNGRHVCMAFEMLGDNLLKVIKKYDYRGIPIPIVKNFVRQILVGLDFLHRHCSIIHTDLKPENILIGTPPPLPSMERVKKIIVDSNGGNKTATTAGKLVTNGTKKKLPTPVTSVNTKIETMQKELQCTDAGLTAEEKKKLKKKIKKKKQQVRKNETRNVDSPKSVGKHHCESLSCDNSVAVEMMLMEQDSIPLAMKGELSRAKSSASPAEDEDISSQKHIIDDDDESLDIECAIDNQLRIIDSIDIDDDDDDGEEYDNYPDNSIASTPVTSRPYGHTIPSWVRPTLFGYLNLSDTQPDPHGASKAHNQSLLNVIRVQKNSYCKPPPSDYTKITLVSTNPVRNACIHEGPWTV
jgi:serine/threonine protein kinase